VSDLKSVCVYCGSSPGNHAEYADVARTLGRQMAEDGIDLVFGGGDVGVMGTIANAVVDHGGRVTGIIPEFLRAVEMPSERINELIVTESMHERKALMYERSDAFCALPGGIGTLEEIVEMISWAQLNQHRKPIVLVNLRSFWDPFTDLLDHMIDQGFARADIRRVWRVVDTVQDVLPTIRDWLGEDERDAAPKF